MVSTVQYGNTELSFSLSHTERKNLTIEVHPDLSIRVLAPENSTIEEVQDKVLKRGKWIVKQQLYFEQFLPRTPEREYVSGESHFYLGRKYLLRIRESDKNQVKLKGGELVVFLVKEPSKELIKRLLSEWYYNHAKKRFNQCVQESVKKFNQHGVVEIPQLVIRRMSKRWGSCTPKGQIILNPEIIKTPSKCVEYVVIHELCHLIHANHSKAFYDLQEEIMPNWEKWKLGLEKTLI